MFEPVPEPPEVVRDDLLRLVFTCCHPSLATETQVALALRTLGGLSTAEVARALLVSEATKRLTRAKQKIAQARIPYRVPPADELPDRLAGVAATVYLIFNEGYAAGAGPEWPAAPSRPRRFAWPAC
jgi:predicted RNA polymerase sigma factor